MDLSALVKNKTKLNQFYRKGIYTVEDLLRYMPRHYIDYRHSKLVKDMNDGEFTSLIGVVEEIKTYPKMIRVIVKDSMNWKMDMIWFQSAYIKKILKVGEKYIFCGKVNINTDYGYRRQIINPIFSKDIEKYQRIVPVYSKIEGMSDDYLNKTINEALAFSTKKEYLDISTLREFNLIRSFEMERIIHQPETLEEIERAKDRLVFDELFRFSMIMNHKDLEESNTSPYIMKKGNTIKPFMDTLPFTLTEDQLNTVRNIYKKMRDGIKTNSLVQGDVGCGKTMVAILLMLISAENGYQSALMAPTNVLAEQHYYEIKELTKNMEHINCVFLSGEMKAKERREALAGIKDGTFNIIIGTHAIISKTVEFKNLALTIVDEEHRFGVMQRENLREKAKSGVHTVTMSATPIPRSLALTIYGNGIDVYTIKTMPSGRKKIVTKIETEESKVYDFMLSEIKKGRQCYIVCPLIEESDSERLVGVKSVDETYNDVMKYFKSNPEVKLGKITGKMKKDEVNEEINKFKELDYNIIISTTIIEVGVNVPNATVMVIQNAERFGLAQLHQLRGRVGRGSHQSYCLLLTQKEDVERLNIMEETTDGFEISKKDLELRGLGDFIGTKQTGDNKAVMLMLANPDLYERIKNKTMELLQTEEGMKMYDFIIEEYDMETESKEK